MTDRQISTATKILFIVGLLCVTAMALHEQHIKDMNANKIPEWLEDEMNEVLARNMQRERVY